MNCQCCSLSPFRWADYPRSSIFAGHSAFADRGGGKSHSQISSEAATRYQETHGVSMGSVSGISAKADAVIEAGNYYRRRNAA